MEFVTQDFVKRREGKRCLSCGVYLGLRRLGGEMGYILRDYMRFCGLGPDLSDAKEGHFVWWVRRH